MHFFKHTLLVFFTAAMLVSCGTAEGPDVVVEKFENAMNRLDFETAKTYAANDIISWIEIVKMGIAADDIEEQKKESENISVRIVETAYVDGKNKAIVTIEVINGDEVEKKERYLVKQDGKWKVTTHWLIPE